MGHLQESWGSFDASKARNYLRGDNDREQDGRRVLRRVLKGALKGTGLRILDIGCGNGNLFPLLREAFPNCSYTGVDVSAPLLAAAMTAHPEATFVETDCEVLDPASFNGATYDVAIYSHVIEMLESPERSLAAARALAPRVVIEFFEPPSDNTPDIVELRTMDHGQGPVPYLRRRTSLRVYEAWLMSAGYVHVDRFFTKGKYEVHLLQ